MGEAELSISKKSIDVESEIIICPTYEPKTGEINSPSFFVSSHHPTLFKLSIRSS